MKKFRTKTHYAWTGGYACGIRLALESTSIIDDVDCKNCLVVLERRGVAGAWINVCRLTEQLF